MSQYGYFLIIPALLFVLATVLLVLFLFSLISRKKINEAIVFGSVSTFCFGFAVFLIIAFVMVWAGMALTELFSRPIHFM
ncbi:MAG: hypothetical protein E7266_04750 [Lachnospiraceae bacterium]|nr:hypothetical protein [Lachnospiraceae bacterium]